MWWQLGARRVGVVELWSCAVDRCSGLEGINMVRFSIMVPFARLPQACRRARVLNLELEIYLPSTQSYRSLPSLRCCEIMLASINTSATVVADVEEASAAVDGAEENGNTPTDENEASEPVPEPLCRSSRVKGYLLLLVSASLNFEAVLRLHRRQGYFVNTDVKDMNWVSPILLSMT